MTLRNFTTIAAAAIVLFNGFPTPAARAQNSPPSNSGQAQPADPNKGTPPASSSANPFAQAEQMAKEGKTNEAVKEYERIFDETQKNQTYTARVAAEAVFRAADVLAKAERFEEAAQEYSKVVHAYQRSNRELAAEALYRQAQFLSGPVFQGNSTDRAQDGDWRAYQAARQLHREFPDTEYGKKAESLRATVGARVDERNSKHWMYQVIHSLVRLTGEKPGFSYWFALVLLAVVIRGAMYPLTLRQYKAMREMQRMQPIIKKINEDGKASGMKQADIQKKIMDAYKEHGVNPFASCVPTLLQMPFLIGVYRAIQMYEIHFERGHFLWIGSPISHENITIMGFPVFAPNLLWPDIPLLAIYTVTNYVTMRMSPATDPQAAEQQKQMALFTSIMFFGMFVYNGWSSAFVFYWLVLNLITMWQQYNSVYKPRKGEAALVLPDTPAPTDKSAQNGKSAPERSAPALNAANPPGRVRPKRKGKSK